MRQALPALLLVLLTLAGSSARAQMAHQHKATETCPDLTLACATSVTPAFAPDGTLWIAAKVNDKIFVARSQDQGRGFSEPSLVTRDPLVLDGGADARPKIVIDREGRAIVAFTSRDKKFNGKIFVSHSADGGKTFSALSAITANDESQRFVALALDTDGTIFSAWLDKRNRVSAQAKGETYKGAALAFAWSDDQGAHFSDTRIVHEPTCECCRLDIAFAGPGRPVVLFRNMFEGSIRDHAIVTFADRETPGPVLRVSVDDWAIDACPHHGPSLAVAASGTYHAAWFTKGRNRQGLFYARSADGGRSFSEPMAIGNPETAPGRPSLLALDDKIWLAWKEFDGVNTRIMVMSSHDDGGNWSAPKAIAATAEDSDHPVLVGDGRRAYLSWQTQKDGYRLLALEDAS